MERITLSKDEKRALRLLVDSGGLNSYQRLKFSAAVYGLEEKGLVTGFWSEEAGLIDAAATMAGERYLENNPCLYNPVNWAKIAAVGSIAGVAVACVALLISCSLVAFQ